jgi:hypothetical protein
MSVAVVRHFASTQPDRVEMVTLDSKRGGADVMILGVRDALSRELFHAFGTITCRRGVWRYVNALTRLGRAVVS